MLLNGARKGDEPEVQVQYSLSEKEKPAVNMAAEMLAQLSAVLDTPTGSNDPSTAAGQSSTSAQTGIASLSPLHETKLGGSSVGETYPLQADGNTQPPTNPLLDLQPPHTPSLLSNTSSAVLQDVTNTSPQPPHTSTGHRMSSTGASGGKAAHVSFSTASASGGSLVGEKQSAIGDKAAVVENPVDEGPSRSFTLTVDIRSFTATGKLPLNMASVYVVAIMPVQLNGEGSERD